MLRKYIIVVVCLAVCCPTLAQDSSGREYRFHSINSIALVNGNNAVSAALQTVNGFQKGNWFAGIGLGLDYYLYRSVPLFIDLRYEMGKKRNKFFVYGDMGMHFEWVPDYFYNNPSIWNGNTGNEYSNGVYTDAGIGMVASMKKGNALIISLGQSRKKMKEWIHYSDWRTGEMQTDINMYRLNRILLKIGLRF